LQKEKDEVLVQLQVAQDSIATYESEKEELHAKFLEETKVGESQLHKEKEKLLAK
jgi:hypothetical protein